MEKSFGVFLIYIFTLLAFYKCFLSTEDSSLFKTDICIPPFFCSKSNSSKFDIDTNLSIRILDLNRDGSFDDTLTSPETGNLDLLALDNKKYNQTISFPLKEKNLVNYFGSCIEIQFNLKEQKVTLIKSNLCESLPRFDANPKVEKLINVINNDSIKNLKKYFPYKNKTLVMAWAFFCEPCIEDIIYYNKNRKDIEKKFQIIHISENKHLKECKKILQKHNIHEGIFLSIENIDNIWNGGGFPYLIKYNEKGLYEGNIGNFSLEEFIKHIELKK